MRACEIALGARSGGHTGYKTLVAIQCCRPEVALRIGHGEVRVDAWAQICGSGLLVVQRPELIL